MGLWRRSAARSARPSLRRSARAPLPTYHTPPAARMSPTHVRLLKFPVSSPADLSPIESLASLGYAASSLVGVIGKSEGCAHSASQTDQVS